jgi:dihydrodipicolinate synthase/N-acetylneuraminate lyase
MFLRRISVDLAGKKAVVASYGLDYFMWGYDYGCPAWITSLGKVWPQVELDFWRALQSGDRETALRISRDQDRPSRDYAGLKPKRYNYFAMIKALLNMEGLPGGVCRPPLLDWPDEDLPALREEFLRIGLLSQ